MKNVKLQKHFAYKYKDKRYYKYLLVVSKDIIEKLGWREGMELIGEIDGQTLIIRPSEGNAKEMNKGR